MPYLKLLGTASYYNVNYVINSTILLLDSIDQQHEFDERSYVMALSWEENP